MENAMVTEVVRRGFDVQAALDVSGSDRRAAAVAFAVAVEAALAAGVSMDDLQAALRAAFGN